MTMPIQLELTDGQIRASVNGDTNISVTAPTVAEAVSRLQSAVFPTNGTNGDSEREEPDTSRTHIDRLERFAGMLGDSPQVDSWLENMREWRRQVEADPNW